MSIDINVRTLLLLTLLCVFYYCYMKCGKQFAEFFVGN